MYTFFEEILLYAELDESEFNEGAEFQAINRAHTDLDAETNSNDSDHICKGI